MQWTSSVWFSIIIILVIVAGIFLLGSSYKPNQIEQIAPVTIISSPTLEMKNDATLGNYISAPNGMTLYTFKNDKPSKSNCSGTCAVNWPPYTVASESDLVANPAIPGQMSTITRADGTLQVTFNNAPLYFYVKDTKIGDVVGQGVGGVWFVAKQ